MVLESVDTKKLNQAGVKKAITCWRLISRYYQDFELLMSRWSTESYIFIVAWEKFTTTSEDVTRLTMLSLFGKPNTMRTFLTGDDHTKLNNLITDMAASKPPGKSTYTTWLRFFEERDDNRCGYIVKAFLSF